MSQTKKILSRVGSVLFSLLMAFLLVIAVLLLLGKAKNKLYLPYSVLYVVTDSMEDTIPAGSFILVKKADTSKIEERDIITFISHDAAISGRLNTHRVIEVIGDHEEFRTKGDNNQIADGRNTVASDVVAVYCKNLPALTGFARFFTKPIGLISAIAFFVLLGGAWIFFTLRKMTKEEKEAAIAERVAEEVKKLREQDKNS